MWFITGWYGGARYAAFGDEESATVPEWLADSLRLNHEDTGGIVHLIPAGPALKVGDLNTMPAADVVQVLEALTAVSDVSGDLPAREVFPVFDTTSVQ